MCPLRKPPARPRCPWPCPVGSLSLPPDSQPSCPLPHPASQPTRMHAAHPPTPSPTTSLALSRGLSTCSSPSVVTTGADRMRWAANTCGGRVGWGVRRAWCGGVGVMWRRLRALGGTGGLGGEVGKVRGGQLPLWKKIRGGGGIQGGATWLTGLFAAPLVTRASVAAWQQQQGQQEQGTQHCSAPCTGKRASISPPPERAHHSPPPPPIRERRRPASSCPPPQLPPCPSPPSAHQTRRAVILLYHHPTLHGV